MSNFDFTARNEPTFYYIGVTTTQSSIMKVFPEWAKYLGIGETPIIGIDCKLHDNPDVYRTVVKFIKNDKNSMGALVTSHKIDLFEAAKDLFDQVGPYAKLLGETSCISKKENDLWGHAKDPITSGLSLKAILPFDHWKKTRAEICILGAGGASLALTTYLMESKINSNWPSKIYVTNRSVPRLEKMKKIHSKINPGIPIDYFHCPIPEANDKVVNRLKPYSLVVNGTGLGKDAPGSPISDIAQFPENGFAWDFNFRGNLKFLDQAIAQKEEKNLHVENGWVYFLHGWTRVIAEVFHINIPTSGPEFEKLSQIAARVK